MSGRENTKPNFARWCYLYLGYGYIHYKMLKTRVEKPLDERKPTNIVLWVFTIYTALFSVAFQQYENKLNRLINSFGTFVEVFDENDTSKINRLISYQSRTIPSEPNFWNPVSVIRSFYKSEKYEEMNRDISAMVNTPITNLLDKGIRISVKELHSYDNFDFMVDYGLDSIYNQQVSFKNCYLPKIETHESKLIVSLGNSKLDSLDNYFNILKLYVDDSYINYCKSSVSIIHLNKRFQNSKFEGRKNIITGGTIKSDSLLLESSIFDRTEIFIGDTVHYGGTFFLCDLTIPKSQVQEFLSRGEFYNCTVNGQQVSNLTLPEAADELAFTYGKFIRYICGRRYQTEEQFKKWVTTSTPQEFKDYYQYNLDNLWVRLTK